MPNDDALITQVVRKSVDDFIVQETEQLVALVDQVHLDAKIPKNARILAANDAGPVNGNAARIPIESQDGITVEDSGMGEVHVGWMIRTRAGRDKKCVRAKSLFVSVWGNDGQVVCIKESRTSPDQLHAIASVEALSQLDLTANDVISTPQELREGNRHVFPRAIENWTLPKLD